VESKSRILILMIKIAVIWYTFTNLLLFALYGLDKAQAVIGGRRIPEKVFHSLTLAGGFIGGLLGRFLFRHKTRKPVFFWVQVISAGVHCTAWLTFLNR
jgi:uncharacterized membrane protein YsdA (DUF1294 family)